VVRSNSPRPARSVVVEDLPARIELVEQPQDYAASRAASRAASPWTTDSERRVHSGVDALAVTQDQIAAFESWND